MKSKGFTFIEMLVVTTLIAVLTAVGVANFRVANKKARDGRRRGDLEQVRAALELYRTDEGSYPLSVSFGGSIESGTTTYMDGVPTDPDSDNYDYYYTSDGSTYSLCSYLELEEGTDCSTASCGSEPCNYEVTNPQ